MVKHAHKSTPPEVNVRSTTTASDSSHIPGSRLNARNSQDAHLYVNVNYIVIYCNETTKIKHQENNVKVSQSTVC